MAIAFIKGEIQRSYFNSNGKVPFWGGTVKETFTDRQGEERVGGFHDVVAFDDVALEMAAMEEGDMVDLQTRVRYKPDERFVHRDDVDDDEDDQRNPFVSQYVVNKINSSRAARTDVEDVDEEDDPFA